MQFSVKPSFPTDHRVQIAAHKTELTQRALSRIYYGNKSVEMVNEEGWFKYSIGDFTTYADANKFRKQCGVKNAFIVAFAIGANDETPAPVVGSGALSLSTAVMLGALLNIIGAVLFGGGVAKTVGQNMIKEKYWDK